MSNRYSVMLWALPYLVFGYFSLLLDDPVDGAAYVWLPAGIAVAALVLHSRRRWPMLLGSLFAAHFVLGMLWHGRLATALVLAASSTVSVLLAAWITRAISPRSQGLRFTGALVVGALLGAMLSAALGGGWAAHSKSLPSQPLLIIWAAANVAGILIVAPMVTSWAHFRARRSGGPPPRDFWVGAAAYAALLISAFLIFDGRISQQFSAALSFQLTYLPLVFAVLVALVWGHRGGTIAVFTLALMALYQSAQGDGPFGSPGVPPGAALLHAQAYLAVSALLVLLVNALRGEREQALQASANWHERLDLALSASRQLVYQFDPAAGTFEWAGDTIAILSREASALQTVGDILRHVHPDDIPAVRARWATRSGGRETVSDTLSFRLRGSQGAWQEIRDVGTVARDENELPIIVSGTWQVQDAGRVR